MSGLKHNLIQMLYKFTGEGNFDTILAENQNAIGTIWNAWETQWSGSNRQFKVLLEHIGNCQKVSAAGLQGAVGIVQLTSERGQQDKNRNKHHQVVEQIDTEVVNDRLVSTG